MKANLLIRCVTALAGLASSATPLFAAPPVVKTVPWVPASPLIPHDTYPAKSISLKATCDLQGANIRYTWDFGDGSPVATGVVTNRYAVEASHTYTGAVGTVFTARVTVENTATNESTVKPYYVVMQAKTLPVEVNVTIDEGLWYLWKNAVRSGGSYIWNNNGSAYPGYSGNSTASVVQAFQVHGHRENQPDNPYSEAVTSGIDYLTSVLYSQTMSLQGGENPDSNGNGIGLSWNSDHPAYETGAVIDALVASGTPDVTARTGNANVLGKTYKTIVQDMVDMFAWGQADSGSGYGGWQYAWNVGSDNSAAQWGAIGGIAAERFFGCTVPAWVKTRNLVWLNYSFNPAGYFGYTSPYPNRWYSTGPCGMVQLAFDGMTTADPKWDTCASFFRINWDSFIGAGDTRYYGFYAFTKAMRTALPAPVVNLPGAGALPPLDWYGDNTKGLARILVNAQTAGGFWPQDGWPYVGYHTAAGWNLIILSPTLFQAGSPVAVAKATPNPAVAGQIIQLDGSDSYHQDAGKSIVSWEWDLDNNGTFDVSGPFPTVSFPVLGDYPVKLKAGDNATPNQGFSENTIIIRITTPPVAPTANAGGPYSLCPQVQRWLLDGSRSVNPDEGLHEFGRPGDTIISYEWDLDGDGAYDDATGPTPDVTAFFTALGAGSYLIQLKVTDNTALSFPSSGFGNLSDTDSAVVVVRSATDPACSCIRDLVGRAKPGKVDLLWTHSGAHHYNVYRGTVSAGPYLKIGSTTSTYSTYLDNTVVNGTTYYYVVRPANAFDQEQCQSNEASVRPVATRR